MGALDYSNWQTQAYATWQAENFTPLQQATASISGATADPDGDGRINRLEWLLLDDPLTPDAGEWAAIDLFTNTATGTNYYDGAMCSTARVAFQRVHWRVPAAGKDRWFVRLR